MQNTPEKNLVNKSELREKILCVRKNLKEELRHMKSRDICERTPKLDAYREAEIIAAYMPVRGEVDPTYVLKKALADGKCIALPIVRAGEMHFLKVKDLSDFVKGFYGIPEPRDGEPVDLQNAEKCLVLVPGIAFSEKGYRIGYGGGYYDRYFRNRNKSVILSALAYEEQIVSDFLEESHDVSVDFIVTDRRVICPEH